MGASILNNAAWRRASSLAERLSGFRQAEKNTQVAIDHELAAETLALWKASSPFDKDSYFADRLATEGISEDEFTRLLGTPVEAFDGDGTVPQWVQMLSRAYSGPAEPLNDDRGNWVEVANYPEAAFLELVEPLMMDARLQLRARVEKIKLDHPAAPFAPERAVDVMFANLPSRLLMLIAKTMVLELHVARLEGVLEGATPAERFANFTERLSRREIALPLL